MSEALIIRNDSALSIAFSEQAVQLKEDALTTAALIGKVDSAATQEQAVAAQVALKTLISSVEKARTAVKAPILDYGRKIDDAAKKFVGELNDEMMRISKLVGDFQQLEAAKAAAAERARRLEEERIERERQAEIRRIQEEQLARERALREEEEKARRAAQEARNAEERKKAEALRIEIEKNRALAEAKSHEQLDAAQQKFNDLAKQQSEVAPIAPARAEGQRVVEDWEITVTDIWALSRAHPGMVKIEPRLSEIKAALKGGVKVAGILAKPITKATVRVGRTPAAIEV